ncbi:hypothetical protein Tco_1104518 [Tanacetum coccineum]
MGTLVNDADLDAAADHAGVMPCSTRFASRFAKNTCTVQAAVLAVEHAARTFVGVADAARNLEILRDRDDYDRNKGQQSQQSYNSGSQQTKGTCFKCGPGAGQIISGTSIRTLVLVRLVHADKKPDA